MGAKAADGESSSDAFGYDSFISYCAADSDLARAIQRGLHRIGRGLGRLRARRVFRFETDMVTSPALWPVLQDALDRSRSLIVLLSPDAAGSAWVDREVAYWVERHGSSRLFLVLGRGCLAWDAETCRFDTAAGDAAPPTLTARSVFVDEPGYVDLTWVGPAEQADLRTGRFRDKIVELAAAVDDRSRDEIDSDDLRELRRFRRYRRAAVSVLAILTVASMLTAAVAVRQRDEAVNQRAQAVSRQLVTESHAARAADPRAAMLMAAGAWRASATPESEHAMLDSLAQPQVDRIDGHDTPVADVAFAWGGDVFVSAGFDNAVRVWDARTHRQLGPALVGYGSVIDVLPGGRAFVSAGPDGTLRLVDVDSRRVLRTTTIPGDTSPVSVDASLDDGAVLVSTGDRSVWMWDTVADSRRLLVEPRWPNPVSDLDVVPAEALLPGGRSEGVATWGQSAPIAISSEGGTVVVGRGAGTVTLHDPHTGQQVGERATGETGRITTLAFSPVDDVLVATTSDGAVWMWDSVSSAPGQRPAEIAVTGFALALAFSTDGQTLAVGQTAGWGDPPTQNASLWDVPTREPVGEGLVAGNGAGASRMDAVGGLAFGPEDHVLLSGSDDGNLRIWDLSRHQQLGPPLARYANPEIPAIALTSDGSALVVIRPDGTVDLWDTRHRSVQSVPLPAGTRATALAMSPDDRTLAIGGDDGKIRFWDLQQGHETRHLDTRAGEIRILTYDDDGDSLLSGAPGIAGSLQLWDTHRQRLIGTVQNSSTMSPPDAALSPDGDTIALPSVDTEATVDLRDATTGQLIGTRLRGHDEMASSAFDPDGRFLVTGGTSGAITIWDPTSHHQIDHPIIGHSHPITSMELSTNGDILASASSDGIRVWHIPSGRQIGPTLTGHNGVVTDLTLSADGRMLASVGSDSTMRLWGLVTPNDAAAAICHSIGGSFSQNDWNQTIRQTRLSDAPFQPVCA